MPFAMEERALAPRLECVKLPLGLLISLFLGVHVDSFLQHAFTENPRCACTVSEDKASKPYFLLSVNVLRADTAYGDRIFLTPTREAGHSPNKPVFPVLFWNQHSVSSHPCQQMLPSCA